METSEGFNDFMYEMGVNFVTRNIANNLYPLQKITQDPADELVTLGDEEYDTEQEKNYVSHFQFLQRLSRVLKARRLSLSWAKSLMSLQRTGETARLSPQLRAESLLK